jgi:hypothetical protein
MNHTLILKRAWHILWSYKMLWVFGILLAITAGGGGNGANGANNFRYDFPRNDFSIQRYRFSPEVQELVRHLEQLFSSEMLSFWIGLGIALLCLALLVAVIFTILKYVSHVALIRMVDGHETSGEKAGFRQGWRLGWSRHAWRLFLIDLAIGIPLALILLVLFGCALTPVILSAVAGRGEPGIGSVLATTGIFFVLMFVVLGVSLVVGLVINLIRRSCVLGGVGVIESIRQGVKLFTSRFKDTFVMWLILAGVHLAYAILLIPLVLLLLGIGLVLGGGLGVAAYFGLQSTLSQLTAILTATVLGLTLFFTVLGIPLTFLEGLRQTYFSTTWTLAYRDLTLAPAAEALVAPVDAPPPAEATLPLPSA